MGAPPSRSEIAIVVVSADASRRPSMSVVDLDPHSLGWRGQMAPVLLKLAVAEAAAFDAHELVAEWRRHHPTKTDNVINGAQRDALDQAVLVTAQLEVEVEAATRRLAAIPPMLFRA